MHRLVGELVMCVKTQFEAQETALNVDDFCDVFSLSLEDGYAALLLVCFE